MNAANADKITPLHVVLAPPKTTTDDLDDDVVGGLVRTLEDRYAVFRSVCWHA